MEASINRSPADPGSSGLVAIIGTSAPHLTIYAVFLLLALYGYEIFNFSLSIDEELVGSPYISGPWLGWIAQGRWGMGALTYIFPPLGNIPLMSTVLFCAGLGVSSCLVARVLFRSYSGQWAFVGLFLSSPLWPHIAEFNTISWGIGIGCVLLTLSLLFTIAELRFGYLWAVGFLAIATGIYQSFYIWFLVLVCIRYLAMVLGTAPASSNETNQRFPWLKSSFVALGGLLGYLAVEKLFLATLKLQLTYVEGYVRLADFTTVPAEAFARILKRCWNLISGTDALYLDYGHLLTLLPMLGLLIVVVRLFGQRPLTRSQRIVAGAALAAAFVLGISPILMSAGTIPARALIPWIPISGFLAGVTLSGGSQFKKLLYAVLAITLFISVWTSVSLFYTDHLVRQRDELLAARIMARVDQLLPNPPPDRIPFVVVGAPPAKSAGAFQKLEVFGDSYFDTMHEGGNAYRIAAYLRLLGVDTLEPHQLKDILPQRSIVQAMPVWPAPGSVAMVGDMLVIKLGTIPPA